MGQIIHRALLKENMKIGQKIEKRLLKKNEFTVSCITFYRLKTVTTIYIIVRTDV